MKYAPERVHRPTDMKVLNRKAIISLFNTKTSITVADIVEKIKISKPTANVLIKETIAEDFFYIIRSLFIKMEIERQIGL